jgi:hypothetical protein
MYTTCLIKILALVKNYFRGMKPNRFIFVCPPRNTPSISEVIKLFFIRTRVNLKLFDEFCNWIILIWADPLCFSELYPAFDEWSHMKPIKKPISWINS